MSEQTMITNTSSLCLTILCFASISYTGFVSDRFGEAAVMGIGAVWGLLTMISALWLMKV